MSLVRTAFPRLSPKIAALLICDIQEKLRDHISYFPQIVEVSRRLLEAAKILKMQVITTEQYPQEESPTVSELGVRETKMPIIEKTKFSMVVPPVEMHLGSEIKSIILCGCEAHVCVFHTALDFLADGYNVHVVVDATSSRSMVDRMYAFKQLEKAGAILTTSECVIMALIKDAEHPKFEECKQLVLKLAPDSGLLSGDKAHS